MATSLVNFSSNTDINAFTTTDHSNTTDCSLLPQSDKPTWKAILESIIVISITCMTIFSNITNILILRSLPSWGNNTSYFLINLAITDLGVGVFLMSLAIYPVTANLDHWPYGLFVCQLSSYLGCVFCSTSIISLCLISIDRYIAITKALAYYELMTEKRCYFLITATWVYSFLFYIPIFIDNLVGVKYNHSSYLCSANFGDHFYFMLALVILILLPCGLIMMVIYSKLLIIALYHSTKIQTQEQAVKACSHKGKQVHRNRKAIRTLLIITGCFTVAWLPYTVLALYRSFQDPCIDALPHWVEFALPWMAMSNSFTNSIVYFAFNKEYRLEAAKLFGFAKSFSPDENGFSIELQLPHTTQMI